MSFHRSTPNFLVSLMVLVLLNACTNHANYAPVITNNGGLTEDQQNLPGKSQDRSKADYKGKQAISEGKQNILKSKQHISKENKIVIEDGKQFHLVKNGETLYSIGLSSGYGYQRLALWNNIPPPYKVIVGEKIKFFSSDLASESTYDEQQIIDAVKISSRLKNAGNSLANKTYLENRSQHIKPQTNLAVIKKTGKKQKKSIETIDNKRIIELNFGWPVKGSVLKRFSPSRNKGIDIAGKKGQPVKATEAGKVVYGGEGLIGFGKLLIIKHNDVYLSAYANTGRLLVNEGEQVEKDQIIAEVAEVGIKRTSLHFEIRKNGKPVNPLKLLPKR